MYYTNIQPLTHKIFAAGIKMFEYLKLCLKPGMYKNTDHKEWLKYLLNYTGKNLTVIDIGNHRKDFLFDMIKLSNHSGKLIAFESDMRTYNYFIKMMQWLKLKNVIIENLSLPLTVTVNVPSTNIIKKSLKYAAPVFDLKERINREPVASLTPGTIDNYLLANKVKPHVLKIKAEGNELEILKSSIQTLETHKPKILLECRETQRNKEGLLTTFKFLEDLKYSGYFILDTMKIPLSNFDFNIYQNEVYGFYCNNFLFER